jgi:replicative DNA helicase
MTADLRDFHAELMWLGACWHSAGRILEDSPLTVDDFQHGPHRRLFEAFTVMHGAGVPFDAAGITRTLAADLPRAKDALAEVVTCGAVPQSAGWHANVLTRLSVHRRLVEAATRIVQAANGDRDVADLAELARAQVDDALGTAATGPAAQLWSAHLDRATQRWATPIADAVPTGWHDLDEMLSGGGLRPGHLTVVGARPGVGKSLVATMLAGYAASARDGGVYFASVEMSADELTDRVAAASAGVNLSHLTNRTLSEEETGALRRRLAIIRDWPLDLDDHVTTIADIRRGTRNALRRHGRLRLVLVDYLQLLDAKPTHKTANRQEMVSDLSRSLKLLARDHHVPVVMLAQLNRGAAQRSDKRPLLTDLRESGSLEQDGDEVILLHRDDTDPDLAGQIELHLAKNRHGPTGTVRLRWQPQLSRITNLSTYGSAA